MDRLIRMAMKMLMRHGMRRMSKGKAATTTRHSQTMKSVNRIRKL